MRIYTLVIKCGDKYPMEPPQLKFISKINMDCVNKTTGYVEPSKFDILKNWKHEFSIEYVLTALRMSMSSTTNKKLPQPPEGTNF